MARADRPGGHTGIYLSAATRETLERLKTWPGALLREVCASIDAGETSLAPAIERARVAAFRRRNLADGPRYTAPEATEPETVAPATGEA